MIKQIWIAQCDLCGKTEPARMVSGRYNETEPTLPIGWERAYNKKVHFCPECAKLVDKKVHTRGEFVIARGEP